MQSNAAPQSATSNSRLLRDFYNQLVRVEYANPNQAFKLLDVFLERKYNGPPDLWHNVGMIASRLNHPRRLEIIRAGLREWPEDVDLLCDDFQFCYGSENDPARAQEIWSKLESMDEGKTGQFWRFWVYGAIYNAKIGRVQEGLDLLDRGVLAVKRDSLMDVFRGYRNVLVDHVPQRVLANEKELITLHTEILEILEARLSLGIRLGIENSYVLAVELARLYQEMAGTDFFKHDINQVEPGEMERRVNDKLRHALDILHLAECLYTGNPNHPIQEIYERRINILMALREYDEALKLLVSIAPGRRQLEEQRLAQEAMHRFATLKTGGSLDNSVDMEPSEEDKGVDESAIQRALNLLFANEGEALETFARANPSIQEIVLKVASELA